MFFAQIRPVIARLVSCALLAQIRRLSALAQIITNSAGSHNKSPVSRGVPENRVWYTYAYFFETASGTNQPPPD